MIDWHTIDAVLFDMDGTLLDLHYDNYFWNCHLPQHYAALHQLPVAEAVDLLLTKIRAQRGTLNFYCIDYWSEQLQLDIVALKREVVQRIGFLPHATDLLAALAAMPVSCVIVTNAHRKTLDIKQSVVDISGRVDRIYSAHDFGFAKEQREFWPRFAATHSFSPQRTLLVDDNAAVLDTAAAYGIRHCVLPLNPDSQITPRRAAPNSPHHGITSLQALLP